MGIAFRELQHCNNRNMRLVFSLYTTRTVMQNSDRASHFWGTLSECIYYTVYGFRRCACGVPTAIER